MRFDALFQDTGRSGSSIELGIGKTLALGENFALELWRFRRTTIINERLEVALGIASWHIEAAEREMRMPLVRSVARSIINRSVKRLNRARRNCHRN
jgi:hypothetical protein